jgi:ribonuclease VapC
VIVVDASALLAILLEEDDGPTFLNILARAGPTLMSSVNYWEALTRAAIVKGAEGHRLVDDLMRDLGIAVHETDQDHARRAAVAFERFRGRPARLNLGDSFAYALAMGEGDGLLFKGNDFPQTDVKPAQP